LKTLSTLRYSFVNSFRFTIATMDFMNSSFLAFLAVGTVGAAGLLTKVCIRRHVTDCLPSSSLLSHLHSTHVASCILDSRFTQAFSSRNNNPAPEVAPPLAPRRSLNTNALFNGLALLLRALHHGYSTVKRRRVTSSETLSQTSVELASLRDHAKDLEEEQVKVNAIFKEILGAPSTNSTPVSSARRVKRKFAALQAANEGHERRHRIAAQNVADRDELIGEGEEVAAELKREIADLKATIAANGCRYDVDMEHFDGLVNFFSALFGTMTGLNPSQVCIFLYCFCRSWLLEDESNPASGVDKDFSFLFFPLFKHPDRPNQAVVERWAELDGNFLQIDARTGRLPNGELDWNAVVMAIRQIFPAPVAPPAMVPVVAAAP
jgi:hypothetical protein